MVQYLEETSEIGGIRIRKVCEGSTYYWIPDPYAYFRPGRYLPADLPVFYNPSMEINRDLTIIALAAYSEIFDVDFSDMLYVEALAGTGIRGFRIVNELGDINVILNDINPTCVRFMQFNLKCFPVKMRPLITVLNYDASVLLSNMKDWLGSPDAIDIDPFGSPTPFIDSAIRSLKRRNGLLLVTATDTAPLVGKFEKAAYRKYGIRLKKTPFGTELGVRGLISFLEHASARYGIALKPMFGFFLRNFIKVCLVSIPGKKVVDKFFEKIGFITYRGGEIREVTMSGANEAEIIGPIWLGEIFDKEFTKKCLEKLRTLPIGEKTKKELTKWLTSEVKTTHIKFFYNIEHIASELKKPTPRLSIIIQIIREKGYTAERTHFDPKAIKTDAPYQLVKDIIRTL